MQVKTTYMVEKEFFSGANDMRTQYLKNFADPREAIEERFVWDFWNIPDQYCLMRTPAYHYFDEALYEGFEKRLLQWGKENLGCFEISPPWLSFYTEGCFQSWHADNPHGPWAYVFSLTDWENRKFQGGETCLLQPTVLDYWDNFGKQKGLEFKDLVRVLEPEFNRLVVFDPRIPHSVNRVSGTFDPREARLVIHGWFIEPRPYVEGGLEKADITESINNGITPLLEELADVGDVFGYLATRISVDRSGAVDGFTILVNTLVAGADSKLSSFEIEGAVKSHLKALKFPQAPTDSIVTLPLIFE